MVLRVLNKQVDPGNLFPSSLKINEMPRRTNPIEHLQYHYMSHKIERNKTIPKSLIILSKQLVVNVIRLLNLSQLI